MKISLKKYFDCQDATHLASEKLERPLSLPERLFYRLHLTFCKNCRRYLSQLRLIHDTASKAGHLPGADGLSEEAKARIRNNLENT